MAAHMVNWFEIPVTDMARAKQFYESVFEVSLTDMEMGPSQLATFPMEQGGTGATGALMLSEFMTPSHTGSLVYFTIPSIEVTLEKINQAGGKTLMPLTGIGEHGHIAHFEDCEGNRVALHQAPAN